MLFGLWYSNKKTTKLTKTINITVEIKISFVCKLKLAKRFLEKKYYSNNTKYPKLPMIIKEVITKLIQKSSL